MLVATMAGSKISIRTAVNSQTTAKMGRPFRAMRNRSAMVPSPFRFSQTPGSLSAEGENESISNWSNIESRNVSHRPGEIKMTEPVSYVYTDASAAADPLREVQNVASITTHDKVPMNHSTTDSSYAIAPIQVVSRFDDLSYGIDFKADQRDDNSILFPAKSVKQRQRSKGGINAIQWLRKAVNNKEGSSNASVVSFAGRLHKSKGTFDDDGAHSIRLGRDYSMRSPRDYRFVARRKVYPDTSEAQQRRWLLQVNRAIRDGAVREVLALQQNRNQQQLQQQQQQQSSQPQTQHIQQQVSRQSTQTIETHKSSLRRAGRSIKRDENNNIIPFQPEPVKHVDFVLDSRKQSEHGRSSLSGSYDDHTTICDENADHVDDDDEDEYSYTNPHPTGTETQSAKRKGKGRRANGTFDDEVSVSSIELLFNWLTCRDTAIDDKRRSGKRLVGMELDLLRASSSDPYNPNAKSFNGFCRG